MEEYKFVAKIVDMGSKKTQIELRNKFTVGESLEVLSANKYSGKTFVVEYAKDEKGNDLTVCNRVKQLLTINCPYPLQPGDILRKKL